MQIPFVSSNGMFVNKETRSKLVICRLLFCMKISSTKEKESLTVNFILWYIRQIGNLKFCQFLSGGGWVVITSRWKNGSAWRQSIFEGFMHFSWSIKRSRFQPDGLNLLHILLLFVFFFFRLFKISVTLFSELLI